MSRRKLAHAQFDRQKRPERSAPLDFGAVTAHAGVAGERPGEPQVPPVVVAGMGVEMLGDLPHVTVEFPAVGTEALVCHLRQHPDEVFDDLVGRGRPVAMPHDHRHATSFTVGHPPVFVFGVPMGEPIGSTELAGVVVLEPRTSRVRTSSAVRRWGTA